jgi:UbiD family decarboxylase
MPLSGEAAVLMDISWQMEKKSAYLDAIPGLKDLYLNQLGGVTIAQISKKEEGDGQRIIGELFDSIMPSKVVIIVDEDVNIYDDRDVWWALATRLQPHRDVIVREDMPGLAIDPSSMQKESVSSGANVLLTMSSKIGLDATRPLDEPEAFERIRIPAELRKRVEDVLAKGR